LNRLDNVNTINEVAYSEEKEMWMVGWDIKKEPDHDHPKCEHVNPEGSTKVETVRVDKILQKKA
jgi:hypothetical protein